VKLKDRSGRQYILALHGRGVTRVGIGPALIYQGLTWVVHALFFRGQWEVDLDVHEHASGLLSSPQTFVYGPYKSREGASEAMDRMAAQITEATWVEPEYEKRKD
jgi:hypothetical protein